MTNRTFFSTALCRWTLTALLALSVSACGFHLRGNIPLSDSVKNLFVQAPDGTFKSELESILANAGAEIAPSRAASDVVLVIRKAESKKNVGTLDQRGLANSYDLTFFVSYTLLTPEGDMVRRPQSVSERRRFDFDPALVVETESEERELQYQMEQDVALKIVRQLSTVTSAEPLEATSTESDQN